ncbi:hypothetical protein AAC387_Pa04g2384 [Persea americana]
MPLFKRKPFPLAEAPQDLSPDEHVFQVRFTKEIFREYQDYLNRINLYRQRVWTCKVTGKVNLTYEEALVSERRANEKVQQFPKELTAPVLHMIQFSILRLKDLVNSISTRLQEQLLEGAELYGRKEHSIRPCKILKVLEKGADNTCYEVGWLDKYKKVTGTSTLKAEDLIHKKPPFSRDLLKSFIRESTSQSVPWVVHDKLARKYGISTEPPEELQDKFSIRDGYLVRMKQRRENKVAENGTFRNKKRRKLESGGTEFSKTRNVPKEEEKPKEEPIKYPIDDLLVQPGPDDPVFTVRPTLTRDFCIPMDCVGDLLMVWDFCSSFGRLLHLWPFSLEDFENAICHKDSNQILIMESHSAILHLLIRDKGEYFASTQKKRRKSKITLINWAEYLCDFLEMKDIPELTSHMGTIRRGHYGLLDPRAKLHIFRELVSEVLSTDAVRQQLDEYIEQQHALVAAKRGEAVEEARKKRNEKQNMDAESGTKELVQGHDLEKRGGNLYNYEDNCNHGQNGDVPEGKELISCNGNHASSTDHPPSTRKKKHELAVARKHVLNQRIDAKPTDSAKEVSGVGDHKKTQQRSNNKKRDQEKSTKEQRKERFEREVEKRFIRTNPLGKDRNYNRYWFFRRDGRIFVESSDCKQWGYYSAKEELDMLMASLNPKGERELALRKQLEKYYLRLCTALQKRSKDLAQRIALEEAVLRRSTRVQSKAKDSPAKAFLKYVNKWKED